MKCGCRKNGKPCGPGCRCQGCTNLPVANQELNTPNVSNESEDESSSDEDNSEQSEDEQLYVEMETEMVTEDFDDLVVDLPP